MQSTTARTQATPKVVAQALTDLLQALMRGTGHDVVAALEREELTITQWKALHQLAEADEDMSVKALGGCIALSLPAASRTADGLLQRGLVARREDAEDRRIKRLTITPAGRAVLHSLHMARLAGVERWAEALSDAQRTQLHEALLSLPLDDDTKESR